MAQSTFGTKLYVYDDESQSWEKLPPIKDFSDLGGEPEMIETTTLEDPNQTNIFGVQSMDTITFTTNFDKSDFYKFNRLADHQIRSFKIVFSHGTLDDMIDDYATYWKGQLSIFKNGGAVNEVIEATVSISCSSPISNAPFADAPDPECPNEEGIYLIVRFNLDGGTGNCPDQSVELNGQATEPSPAPTKSGSTFDGWYLGASEYVFTTPVTRDITLKAHWTE